MNTKPLYAETHETVLRSLLRRIDRLERRGHGRWHDIGASGEPAFGGTVTQAAGYVPTRYRRLLGGGTEVQIAVDGGGPGDVVWTFPAGWWFTGEGKIPANGHDSTGAYRAFYIDTTTLQVVIVA